MESADFIFSGIADEAGKDIDSQIRAHKMLGWEFIEIRTVDGVQFTDVTDEKFDEIGEKLADARMRVSCFASGIANRACKVTEPVEKSIEALNRAIPRMHDLDTEYIRAMSYPNNGLPEEQWRDEAVRRMKALGQMAEDAGIIIVVENCDGWASTSPENYARFFEMVDCPAVRAVYDTGNPASHGHTNTWDWYLRSKPHIAYVHIKAHTDRQGDKKGKHVWPDAGASKVVETLQDLLAHGYHGFVSIEPHLKAIIHEGKKITDAEAALLTYVEYGQRLMRLVEKLK